VSEPAAAVAPPQKVNAPAIATKQDDRLLRRKCACGGSAGLTGACKECDENRLRVQRRALSSARPFCPTHVVNDVLTEEGEDLDESTRMFMETELGHDFRRVRVHTNARASESARAVNALAYTVGTDIVFASGTYQPHTHSGRHLIAHELVHTLQQNSQPRGQQAKLEIGEENDEFEREADRVADHVMRRSFTGAVPPPPSPPPPRLPASSIAPLIQRAPAEAASVQPEPQASESATPEPGLIVDDKTTELGPGQMRKSQFLDELRAAACTAADAELERVGRNTQACPYIARAFERYRTFEPHKLERGLRRYAPEAAGATSAQKYIEAVGARVGRAVGLWATTGEITGVPDELQGEFGMMGFFGGLGGVLSGIGSVVGGLFGGIGRALGSIGSLFFKARAGGARDKDIDPEEIKSELGAGQQLDPQVKSRMENAFGHDFSRVRVHANTQSAVLTSSLNARAFTLGTDVGFAAGEYKPGTLIGDALIAHELAHVVQQGDSARNGSAPMKKETAPNSEVLEEDADESAVGAVASIWGGVKRGLTKVSRTAMPRLKSGLQLQRCSHDYEVNGLSTDKADDSIFFDRRNASIEDSQQPKIEKLKAPPEANLRLYAFVSEDENIPPALGTETATARWKRVDEALRKGPKAHTGKHISGDDKHPGIDTQSGKGKIDYRNMRKVKVVPEAITTSGEKDCSAGTEQPCSDDSKFTGAQSKAPTLLQPAIDALASPLSDAAKKLLDTHFHTTDDTTRDMAAAVVRDNLTKVKDHILVQMTQVGTRGSGSVPRKPGHVCASTCDAACGRTTIAYNNKQDDEALMTLCDTGSPSAFMSETDETKRALTLIHEGLHGITISLAPPPSGSPAAKPTGAKDIAYDWQRVIRYLDTPTALLNNDSYILLLSEVNSLGVKSALDVIEDPDIGDQGNRALGYLQGWLIWADGEIRSLYKTMNSSRKAGKWDNDYYKDTMTRIAPLFDMTKPPALPSEADQVKVAAISDRLTRLARIPGFKLEVRKSEGGSTHWEKGPTGPLTFGKDFYKLPKDAKRPRKQVELILKEMLSATPDISLEDEYMKMIEQIRAHHNGLEP